MTTTKGRSRGMTQRNAGQSIRLVVALAAAALCVALAGCSAEVREVHSKPSKQELQKLRGAAFPVYWFGPSFESEEISAVEMSDSHAVVRYGSETCDDLGDCYVPPVAVWTYKRRAPPALSVEQGGGSRGCCVSGVSIGKGQLCLDRVEGAVLLANCRRHEGAEMYTGKAELGLFNRNADGREDFSEMAAQLELANPAGAATAHPLPPPDPLPCATLSSISPPWFQALAAREFGSVPGCLGNG